MSPDTPSPGSAADGPGPPGLRIRRAGESDIPALRLLAWRAIEALGPAGYAPEAVAAWAAFTHEDQGFRAFVLDHRTWIAEVGEVGEAPAPAGFAGLGPGGYVASLYVAPEHARRGVASALLAHVLETGRLEGTRRFHAAASRLALPVFLRAGFTVSREETVLREGVPLLRYRVVREEASA